MQKRPLLWSRGWKFEKPSWNLTILSWATICEAYLYNRQQERVWRVSHTLVGMALLFSATTFQIPCRRQGSAKSLCCLPNVVVPAWLNIIHCWVLSRYAHFLHSIEKYNMVSLFLRIFLVLYCLYALDAFCLGIPPFPLKISRQPSKHLRNSRSDTQYLLSLPTSNSYPKSSQRPVTVWLFIRPSSL